MSYKPTGRKRGGQPENANALKHGIYSQLISVQDGEQVEPMPHDINTDEPTFARTRLKSCILKQQSAPPEDWLSYEKAINAYLARIVAMVHHNAVLGEDKKAAFLLDVAGQEDASFSFDSKRTGGVELESNLARDAVTLRFRVRRPHRSCRRNGGIVIC